MGENLRCASIVWHFTLVVSPKMGCNFAFFGCASRQCCQGKDTQSRTQRAQRFKVVFCAPCVHSKVHWAFSVHISVCLNKKNVHIVYHKLKPTIDRGHSTNLCKTSPHYTLKICFWNPFSTLNFHRRSGSVAYTHSIITSRCVDLGYPHGSYQTFGQYVVNTQAGQASAP